MKVGIVMALGLLAMPMAAMAQTSVEGRVAKLEKEMTAVQRKVFPGGTPYFEPQNTTPSVTAPDGKPASAPVADLINRVDAMEAQLATITGQVEQQGNRLRKLEDRLAAMDAAASPLAPVSAGVPGVSAAAATPVVSTRPSSPAPKAAPKPAAASEARASAVAAIVRPSTGDAFEDSYSYGYRLWEAKFYPEAQVQLADTIKKYPKHKRVSFARNLLGRAWLDEGKPATSTQIFLDNYQTDPRGERAPDSLYFLGVALTSLKKTREACQAYDELAAVYPEIAKGRLSDRVAKGRADAKCK